MPQAHRRPTCPNMLPDTGQKNCNHLVNRHPKSVQVCEIVHGCAACSSFKAKFAVCCGSSMLNSQICSTLTKHKLHRRSTLSSQHSTTQCAHSCTESLQSCRCSVGTKESRAKRGGLSMTAGHMGTDRRTCPKPLETCSSHDLSHQAVAAAEQFAPAAVTGGGLPLPAVSHGQPSSCPAQPVAPLHDS